VLMRQGEVIADLTAEQLRAEAGNGGLEEYVLRRLRR
jgi:hypothetical protein